MVLPPDEEMAEEKVAAEAEAEEGEEEEEEEEEARGAAPSSWRRASCSFNRAAAGVFFSCFVCLFFQCLALVLLCDAVGVWVALVFVCLFLFDCVVVVRAC